jgi:hypothetical protein
MRISIDRDDPGYMPEGLRWRMPTLNGKPMPHAVTADEELGLIYVFQEEGPPKFLQGEVKLETIH